MVKLMTGKPTIPNYSSQWLSVEDAFPSHYIISTTSPKKKDAVSQLYPFPSIFSTCPTFTFKHRIVLSRCPDTRITSISESLHGTESSMTTSLGSNLRMAFDWLVASRNSSKMWWSKTDQGKRGSQNRFSNLGWESMVGNLWLAIYDW